jgi:GT2 family glycosyltransferase
MNRATKSSPPSGPDLPPSTLNPIRGGAAAKGAPLALSAVIPLYNCLALTRACVESLQATLPSGLDHEIILIDDGSTDGTRDWLASLDSSAFRVLLNDRNCGYAAANNRAATTARGRFLILLNNDLNFRARWLEPMLEAHRELGARAGVIGNVQVNFRNGAIDHAGIVIGLQGKPRHERALPARPFRRPNAWQVVPAVTGACLLVERALWETLDGFDEAYVNGGEDIDFCFRARAKRRINAVALSSVVEHHVSSSPGRKRCDEQNSLRLARRWGREFLACADAGAREWCRNHLAAALAEPRSAEFALTLRAAAHLLGLRRRPPAQAVLGLEENLAREFARWETLFGRDVPGLSPNEAPPVATIRS